MAWVIAIALVLASGAGLWRLRPWRAHDRYRAALAWCWAGLYFGACLLVAEGAGTWEWLREALSAWPAAGREPVRLLHLIGGTALIGVAYGVIWPRGSFTDGRPDRFALSLAFGAAWGLCQGLLFMSLWRGLALGIDTPLGLALAAFVIIGTCNGLWHRLVWDRYVSPPHNYTEWNGRKVLCCHVPNLLVSLSYVALYDDAAVFVFWQMLALALSARAMHFPAPWDGYTAVPGCERSVLERAA